MNALATIFFSLIAILASLVFVVSSLCAFSSSVGTAEDRHFFLQCAVVALLVAIAAQWKIIVLNRKPRARPTPREPDPPVPPYSIAQPGVAPPYLPTPPIQSRVTPDVVKHLSPASQAAFQQLALAIAAKVAAEVILALVGWYVSLGSRAPFPLFRFGFVAWGLAALAPDLVLLYTLTRRPGPIAFAYSLVVPALHILFGLSGHSALLVLIPSASQASIPLLSIIPWILDILILYLAWKAIRLTGIRPDPIRLIAASVVILIYRILLPALFVLLN
jgi:hypothetical protein